VKANTYLHLKGDLMSNINSKKQPISDQFRTTNPPQPIANTYGERSYQRDHQATAPTRPPTNKSQVDQFKRRENQDINIDPNASYTAGRRRFSGAPHKPAQLEGVENGMAGKIRRTNPGQPSDAAIINFLDKVISYTPQAKANQLKRQAERAGTAPNARSRA